MSVHAMLFDARLLEFNFLPSRTMHPTHYLRYGGPEFSIPAALRPAWHRHWSRDILRRLKIDDRPVFDASKPELPLALLPPAKMARLARYVGATLCAARLRCVINGAEVRQLESTLGAEVLEFARRAAPGPTVDGADALKNGDLPEQLDQLGYATLVNAFQHGGAELTLRAHLKLPELPPSADLTALRDVDFCRSLALDVLRQIDPSWHSSFPTMH